jgi:hypothetical protein
MQPFMSKINIDTNSDGALDTQISWERTEELLLQAFYKYNNDVSETRVSAQEALAQGKSHLLTPLLTYSLTHILTHLSK